MLQTWNVPTLFLLRGNLRHTSSICLNSTPPPLGGTYSRQLYSCVNFPYSPSPNFPPLAVRWNALLKEKEKKKRERVTLRALIGGKESVRRGGGDERVGHASIHPRECHVYMHNAGDRGNAFTTSAVEELCYCLKRAVSQWYTGAREKKRNDWRRRTEMGRRGEWKEEGGREREREGVRGTGWRWG